MKLLKRLAKIVLYGVLFLVLWVISWLTVVFISVIAISFFKPEMHSVYEMGPFFGIIVLIIAPIFSGLAALGALDIVQTFREDHKYSIIFKEFFGMSPYATEYDEGAMQKVIDKVLANLAICLFDAFREQDLNIEVDGSEQYSQAELEEIIMRVNDEALRKVINAQKQYASAIMAVDRFGWRTKSDWADYLPSNLRETFRGESKSFLLLNTP